MDDETRQDSAGPDAAPAAPAFDKAAARQRYRATMRGPAMRAMYLLLALVLLAAWGLGIAAAFAPDIAPRAGHEPVVPPRQCIACHSQPGNGAPPLPHPAAPSCGFCHRLSRQP